jgi:hypothetical protein
MPPTGMATGCETNGSSLEFNVEPALQCTSIGIENAAALFLRDAQVGDVTLY